MLTAIPTEVDDGNSGSILSDGKFIDDGLDEVNDELPVVASKRVIVTYTTRVVNHERNVSNTRCNENQRNDNRVHTSKMRKVDLEHSDGIQITVLFTVIGNNRGYRSGKS